MRFGTDLRERDEVAGVRLVRRLGRGGFGEVWEVRTPHGPAALKLVAADRSFDEARAVAALDHPGVVQIYDFGTIAAPRRLGFLLFELAEGTWATRPGRAPFSVLRAEVRQILEALAHVHARGILHLDLKPSNVLVRGAQLALADFGIAHRVGHVGDEAVGGSVAWMAPEQFAGSWRDLGPGTDLYAVGLMAWARLAGQPAFVESDPVALGDRRSQGPPPAPPGLRWPAALHDWFRHLLAARATDRFPDAATALAGWQRLEGGLDVRPLHDDLDATTIDVAPRPSPRAATNPVDEAPPVPWRPVSGVRAEDVLREGPRRRADPRTSPRLHLLRDLGLVGRRVEAERLAGALVDLVDRGRSRRIGIVGAAGTGKSRLAAWCVGRAAELGVAHTLTVRATATDEGVLTALAGR